MIRYRNGRWPTHLINLITTIAAAIIELNPPVECSLNYTAESS
jgi:hypothetical protein